MSEHLPECPVTTQRTEWGGRFPCFCVELRAAERRVREDFLSLEVAPLSFQYRAGREDAARDVAALSPYMSANHGTCVDRDAAVAAARGEKR